jgi:hypothetical protein
VERKLVDDAKYDAIRKMMLGFSLAARRTVDQHHADVFINAFSASYVGGDGVALCSTSHPYSPSDAGVQSNKGTSALTWDTLVTTREAMMRFKDSKRQPMGVMPDTLVVPIELMTTARTLVGSVQKPGTGNNDTNDLDGAFRVVVSPFLTDTNNWFLIDSRLASLQLNWYWRTRPEFLDSPMSGYNLAMQYRGYMRYSVGWDHWAFAYGHEVA